MQKLSIFDRPAIIEEELHNAKGGLLDCDRQRSYIKVAPSVWVGTMLEQPLAEIFVVKRPAG
jgi:hypothetical protein